MRNLPVIAVTMGDPAGVGPEVCLKAARAARVRRCCVPLIVGDLGVLRFHARKMRIPGRLMAVNEGDISGAPLGPSSPTPVLDLANVQKRDHVFGKVRARLGKAAGEYIERAAALVQAGRAAALATGPIHKEALRAAGYPYPGHTEMLADLCGGKPVMMLAEGKVRIAHISTHLPLRDALRRVKRGNILRVIRALADALEALDGKPPRIGVAGLNPHAGEGGLFGKEEEREIGPAIEEARASGIDARGPESPDIVFAKLAGGMYDGAVAMYHDQGHIPGKLLCFGFKDGKQTTVRGVNVTLGLPIVRTSVEHGTAFEIAGEGVADPASMADALVLAARMVRGKEKRKN